MATQVRSWPVVLVAILALALSGSACGDDDDGGEAAGEAAGQVSGEEREIREVYVRMTKALYGVDEATFCDSLTAATRRKISGVGSGTSCQERFGPIVRQHQTGNKKYVVPKILAVDVRGDTATAIVRNRTDRTRVRFAREDGAWKLDGAPDIGS